MIKIERVLDNGEKVEILLTEKEIQEVRRQDNIHWAKVTLAHYEDIIANYDDIISNDEHLLEYVKVLEEKLSEYNGESEVFAINALFEVIEG